MTEKKKVLTVCKGHKNIAGAQLYLKHLAEAFDQNVFDLHYAYYYKDGDRVFNDIAKNKDITTWEYDWRHLCFKSSFQKAFKLFKQIKPELIIYNSNEDEIIPAILAAYVSRVPCQTMVVHWAQDSSSLPLFVKKKSIPFPIISRYALRNRLKRGLSYALLDKIIFVNNITRMAYKKLYKVKKSKCTTIYNGIDIEKFKISNDSRQIIREELSVGYDQIMLLATGNLTLVKGHQVLIDAVEILLKKRINLKCFIAGQGELEPTLKEYIKIRDLAKNISLLGYRNDVSRLLSASDIFCMPSLNEALGYSLLEAMASGKPVVASKVGGIPEVVTDSVNGLLVTPGSPSELSNAIMRLIANKRLRNDLAQNGKLNVVANFSIEKMIQYSSQFLKS